MSLSKAQLTMLKTCAIASLETYVTQLFPYPNTRTSLYYLQKGVQLKLKPRLNTAYSLCKLGLLIEDDCGFMLTSKGKEFLK